MAAILEAEAAEFHGRSPNRGPRMENEEDTWRPARVTGALAEYQRCPQLSCPFGPSILCA